MKSSMLTVLAACFCLVVILLPCQTLADSAFVPKLAAPGSQKYPTFPMKMMKSSTKYGDRQYGIEGMISVSGSSRSQGVLMTIRIDEDESIVVEQFIDTLYAYVVMPAGALRSETLIAKLPLSILPDMELTMWFKIDIAADDLNRLVKLRVDDKTESFRWTIGPNQKLKRFQSLILRGFDGDMSSTLTGKSFDGCIQIDDISGYRQSYLVQLEKALFTYCHNLPKESQAECSRARLSCQGGPLIPETTPSAPSSMVFDGTSRFHLALPSCAWMPDVTLIHIDLLFDKIPKKNQAVLLHVIDAAMDNISQTLFKILVQGNSIILQSDADTRLAKEIEVPVFVIPNKEQSLTVVLKPHGLQVAINGNIIVLDRDISEMFDPVKPEIVIGASANQRRNEVAFQGEILSVLVETDFLSLELLDLYHNYNWHWLSKSYVDPRVVTSSSEASSTIPVDDNQDDPKATIVLVVRDIPSEAAADVFKIRLAVETLMQNPPYNLPKDAIKNIHVLQTEAWVLVEVTLANDAWAKQLVTFIEIAGALEVVVGEYTFHAHLLGTDEDKDAVDVKSAHIEQRLTPEPKSDNTGGSTQYVIIGVVCGIVGFALIVFVIAFYVSQSNRKRKENHYSVGRIDIEQHIPPRNDKLYADIDTENLPVLKEEYLQQPAPKPSELAANLHRKYSKTFEEPATAV